MVKCHNPLIFWSMLPSRLRSLSLCGLAAISGWSVPQLFAESKVASEASFQPTWKLLRNEGKQQFIAGYLFAWRDAKRVTDVAIEYVQTNPSNAVSGLERIRGLYDMEGLTAESVVRELDTFFATSDGKDATLSQAIVAVRGRLGR